jgi:hypothetical protein
MPAAAAAVERGEYRMGIEIKPSDLYFKYRRNKEMRDEPKFTGKPDSRVYDRDDLYDVIPMLAAVMDAFNCRDANVLHRLEELAGDEMPQFIRSREEVFDFLVSVLGDMLGRAPGTTNAGRGTRKPEISSEGQG